MWSVNKEHIQRVKDELQDRYASILARYESEVKSVEDDLNEIEELERMAYAFAERHIPERGEPLETAPEPIVLSETIGGEHIADAATNHSFQRDGTTTKADEEAEAESEDTLEPSVSELLKRPIDAKRLSLWRARRSDVGQ